jgi:hypothetical protein
MVGGEHMYPATDDVIAAFGRDGYGVLLNLRTGRYHPVNETMGDLWCLLDDGHDLDAALQAIADTGDVEVERVREDAESELAKLRRYRMLTARPRSSRLAIRFGTVDPTPSRRLAVTDDERASVSQSAIACVAFVVALALQRMPFRLMLRIMRASRRVRRRQRPTVADTIRWVATVRRVASKHPGWAECHEISIAAFLVLAALGRAPTWLLLAVFDSDDLHACLEVGDTVVDHEPQPDKENHPLVRI